MIFNGIAKAFFVSSVIFKSHSSLSSSLSKLEYGSQSVVVARWFRPAIEQAQEVLLVGYARSKVKLYDLFV